MKQLSAQNKNVLENIAHFFLINWEALKEIRLENLILDMFDGKHRVRVPVTFIPGLKDHHKITTENNHAYWLIDDDPTKLAYFGRASQKMPDDLAVNFLRALDLQLPEIVLALEAKKAELDRVSRARIIIKKAKDGQPTEYIFP